MHFSERLQSAPASGRCTGRLDMTRISCDRTSLGLLPGLAGMDGVITDCHAGSAAVWYGEKSGSEMQAGARHAHAPRDLVRQNRPVYFPSPARGAAVLRSIFWMKSLADENSSANIALRIATSHHFFSSIWLFGCVCSYSSNSSPALRQSTYRYNSWT
jgi:hypothetical protein